MLSRPDAISEPRLTVWEGADSRKRRYAPALDEGGVPASELFPLNLGTRDLMLL
jgi:hypothetical protein